MLHSLIIYKFLRWLLAVDLSPTFLNAGTTDETFQQSGKQDSFWHILKSSASIYKSSGSQFFRTTTGIQSGPDVFDESKFIVTFSSILGVIEILFSFRLVLEGKTGKEMHKSSRVEFLEKFLANSFALLDAEDNTSGLLNRGGIPDLPWDTISNSPKVTRTKFLRSDGLFCFSSIYKFANFKNPFVTLLACLNFT